MIVSIDDIEHVYEQLSKDISFIHNKTDELRKNIQKVIGRKSPRNKAYKNVSPIKYKGPVSKTIWQIFYYVAPNKVKQKIKFIYIIKVETSFGKNYILVDNDNESDLYLHIFSGHFVRRISERSDIKSDVAEEALAIFFLEGEFSFYNYWEYETKEMRHINKWGISLGKYDKENSVMIHKTFINKEQLFKAQKEWIKNLFQSVIIRNRKSTNEAFANCYPEFVSKDDIIKCYLLDESIEKEPSKLRQMGDYYNYNKIIESDDIHEIRLVEMMNDCVVENIKLDLIKNNNNPLFFDEERSRQCKELELEPIIRDKKYI